MSQSGQTAQYVRLGCSLTLLLSLCLAAPTLAKAKNSRKVRQPQASLSGAHGLLNRGLYDLAIPEYEQFLLQHPGDGDEPIARYGLAVCRFRLQQYELAIKELSSLRGLANFAYGAEVATMLGQAHLSLGHFGKAEKAFGDAVRKHREHALAVDASAGLIETLYNLQRFEKVAEAAEAFRSAWPKSELRARIEYFAARALLAAEKHGAAAFAFASVLTHNPDARLRAEALLLKAQCHDLDGDGASAIVTYRELLELKGGRYTGEALLGLAIASRDGGQLSEADKLLQRFGEELPDHPLVQRAAYERGHVLLEAGKSDDAFALFRKVGAQPGDWQDDAAYWAGKCQLRKGRPAAAAARFKKMRNRFPQSDLAPRMCYDHGIALFQAQRFDEVLTELSGCALLLKDHELASDSLYLQALSSHRLGDYDRSLQFCDRYLTGHRTKLASAAVLFLAAENLYLIKRYDEAVTAFQAFLSRFEGDERVAKAQFRRGISLYHLDRYDEAMPVLAKTINRQPFPKDFQPALFAAGDICFHRGEWKCAVSLLTRFLEHSTDDALMGEILIKLGLSHQRLEQYDQALAIYDRLISGESDSPHRIHAMFEKGQILVALERDDEARRILKRVVETGEKSRFEPLALNHIGTIALKQEAYGNAASCFERMAHCAVNPAQKRHALLQRGRSLALAGRNDEAIKVLSGLSLDNASKTTDVATLTQLAMAHARTGGCDEALKVAKRLAKRSGAFPESATMQYEIIWCLRDSDRLGQAQQLYEELLLDRTLPSLRDRATLELADLHYQADRLDKTIELLRLLERNWDESDDGKQLEIRRRALYLLGMAEHQSGESKQASSHLKTYVEEFPQSELAASAGYTLAEALHELGRDEESATILHRFSTHDHDVALHAQTLLLFGDVLTTLRRWKRSDQIHSEYLKRYRDNEQWFYAQFGLAWAREHQEQYDKAISAYRVLTDQHQGPTAARAQFQIGECFFAQGKHEQAARELLKVDILYAYPKWSAAALYEAGRCFEALGRRVEAKKQYREVVDRYGKTEWATMASQRLAQEPRVSIPGRGTE